MLTNLCNQAQQEYDEAKEIFDILNEQYIRELPLFLDTRIRELRVKGERGAGAGAARSNTTVRDIAYLDPSFEAMVRCQLRFAEEGYAKLSGVQRSVSQSS